MPHEARRIYTNVGPCSI